jgi:hypothetical protein
MAHDDKLRRTQVIFTSGPGAIVDLKDCSVVTAGLQEWVDLNRLEEVQYQNRRGFRRLVRPPVVRTNPHTNKPYTPFGVLPVFRFPDWVQCTNPNCGIFGPYAKISATRSDFKCTCGSKTVPARIIRICPDGHMDDFPWDEFYHDGNKCDLAHPKFRLFRSSEQTGTLNDLVLQCKCELHRSGRRLGDIYGFALGKHCRARRPWLSNNEDGCSKKSEVVLRGASNVYFPRIMTELIVPKEKTKIETFYGAHFQKHRTTYFVMDEDMRAEFVSRQLDKLKDEVEALGVDKADVLEEMVRLLEDRKPKAASELTPEDKIREEEFAILSNPAIVDPEIKPKVFSAKRIEADITLQNKGLSKLVCVTRLQEIRVLQGFSRVLPNPKKADQGRVIDLGEGTDNVYLAIEVNGEGLFLSFDEDRLNEWASKRAVVERAGEIARLFSEERGLRPPPFTVGAKALFLHSFSHAIIKQMALFGGYSSVAIREKLYLSETHNGILLYTGESDSEGTMGGITSLGEKSRFTEIFHDAIEDCRWCSSDPICSENQPEPGFSENLAACHACLYLSETSCELSNKILDRHMIVSDRGTGFFDE